MKFNLSKGNILNEIGEIKKGTEHLLKYSHSLENAEKFIWKKFHPKIKK